MSFSYIMLVVMVAAWPACWRVPASAWPLRNPLLASISVGIATEVTALIGMYHFRANSIVYNCAAPLEFLLLLWLIRRFRPRWGRGLGVAAVVGCLAMLVDGNLQDPMAFVLVEGVLVISTLMTIVLLAALWSLARRSDTPLMRTPEFWLFMGLLLYFGGMVPYIGMIRFLFQQNAAVAEKLFMVMPVLCIVRYALVTIACVIQSWGMHPPRHG